MVPDADRPSVPVLNGKHDVHTHRMVVAGLMATVILAVVGIILLEALGRPVPATLGHLASAALGALSMGLSAILRPGTGKS